MDVLRYAIEVITVCTTDAAHQRKMHVVAEWCPTRIRKAAIATALFFRITLTCRGGYALRFAVFLVRFSKLALTHTTQANAINS